MKVVQSLVVVTLLVGLTIMLTTYSLAQTNLPDVAMEALLISNSFPKVGEPVTFTMQIKNVGTQSVIGRRAYLYINPAVQPPTVNISATKELIVAGITWPAGDAMVGEWGNYTFTAPGDYVVYAWVDPLERIEERNEQNNFKMIQVHVAPNGNAPTDAYEPDNDCKEAKAIPTNGTIQTHRFISDNPKDNDWVKFQVVKGEVYTMTAQGLGSQADPRFSMWASCDTPPKNFGSTHLLSYTSVKDGFVYLQLEHNLPRYEANQTAYNLTVEGKTATGGNPPKISLIQPNSTFNHTDTLIKVVGSDFNVKSVIELCPFEANQCSRSCVQMQWQQAPATGDNVNGDKLLHFMIPLDLRPNSYCLAVINPNNQQRGVLAQGLTINAGPPVLNRLQPAQGFNSVPNELHLYGQRLFTNGLSVKLGNTTLTDFTEVSADGTHLKVIIPQDFPVGSYDVTVAYGAAQNATLPQAYTVLALNDDLYAQSQELWLDPVAPQVNETTKLRLLVHRQGGSAPLDNLPVRFFAQSGAQAKQLLGTVNVPSIITNGQMATLPLSWQPTLTGEVELTAIIDPDNSVAESSENNNTVTLKVTVQGAAEDKLAPHVDSLTIANGQRSVTDTFVYLAMTASDPLPGSGVTELRYVEFEFSQGAKLWVPVWASDWLISNTVNSTYYAHQLTPMSGLHYIQAWARDGAKNVSHYPYQQQIEYLPPQESITRDQARVYRRELVAGQTLAVTIKSQSGDPDLYIWPPDFSTGRPPWVSNLTLNAVEYLCVTAPVSGTYQVEVYGYNSARYEITLSQAPCASRTRQGGQDPIKAKRTTPALDPNSVPPLDVTAVEPTVTPTPPASRKVYLPVVVK